MKTTPVLTVSRVLRWVLPGIMAATPACMWGQGSRAPLPEAPTPVVIAEAQRPPGIAMQTESSAGGSHEAHPGLRLTLAEAEQMAIKNNPRVTVARLLAMAQHQVVRATRSAEMPTAVASITAEDAEDASRISAGSLTASRLFTHAGAGGGITQLITDFGRTSNLVAFSKLQEKAQNASALATREDITIAVDQAFYQALEARAFLQVANEDVRTRQATETLIKELTRNKLKSTLDLSFADVNLSQAKLLQLDAENNVESTMAALDAVLGLDHTVNYDLVDGDGPLPAPPADAGQLLQLAMQQRPDLQALDYNRQAAVKYSRAQRDQMFPTISAAGTTGSAPIRPGTYYTNNWWGGVGVNVDIPLFNGFLFSAQAKEAAIRAEAAAEQQRDLKDRIVREVRDAWLAANTAYQRVRVTEVLLKEANLALDLAQTRYSLGLSSIVELSQAQYQQTDAAIGNANARYKYRLALATINYEIGANP